jgi:hypothetical protein
MNFSFRSALTYETSIATTIEDTQGFRGRQLLRPNDCIAFSINDPAAETAEISRSGFGPSRATCRVAAEENEMDGDQPALLA